MYSKLTCDWGVLYSWVLSTLHINLTRKLLPHFEILEYLTPSSILGAHQLECKNGACSMRESHYITLAPLEPVLNGRPGKKSAQLQLHLKTWHCTEYTFRYFILH